jgi:hypothetical protein
MARRVWGLSKKKANYRPAAEPGVRCDRCRYMFPPLALGGCRLVRGLIQASATCDEFTPRRASALTAEGGAVRPKQEGTSSDTDQ